ncbi:MAG: hypothetical protein Q9200_001454 [Gallowayella weberi]
MTKDFKGQNLYVGRAQKKHEREEELETAHPQASESIRSICLNKIRRLDDKDHIRSLRKGQTESGCGLATALYSGSPQSSDDEKKAKNPANVHEPSNSFDIAEAGSPDTKLTALSPEDFRASHPPTFSFGAVPRKRSDSSSKFRIGRQHFDNPLQRQHAHRERLCNQGTP